MEEKIRRRISMEGETAEKIKSEVKENKEEKEEKKRDGRK
jgi:hypothetical protein